MRLLAMFIIALLLSPGWCAAADTPQKVPFKLYRHFLIVVEGSIGDQRHLNFIVDTGTAPSIIHQRLARKLRLTGEKDHLLIANRDLDVQTVALAALEIGPIRSESLHVLVTDLSAMERDFGIRLDGILGFEAFAPRSFSIDFFSKELVFGPQDTSEGLAFEPAMPYMIVPIKLNGRLLRLLVDTGAERLVLFGNGHPFPEFQASRKKTTLSNMGSQIALQRVRLPELRLGDTNLGMQEAFFEQDCARLPACSILGMDGLLPMASLGLRQIHFDFEHGRIGWQK
jgi:predicted aspartyl protease